MSEIHVIGGHGQLGRDVCRELGPRATAVSHQQLEVTNPSAIDAYLQQHQPQVLINLAAYNLVDQAESEPGQAYAVNALGPRHLAIACTRLGIKLVHISTDYVFGNPVAQTPRPWRESDAPAPTSAYAVSKLAGEHFALAHAPSALVVRTCGLYGVQPTRGKGNFVETMLRLGQERGAVSVVRDQTCTPTFTGDLATALVTLVDRHASGLVHLTNTGWMTWHDFAIEIFRQANLTVRVTPITTREFAAKAHRPAWSVLDTSRAAQLLGQQLPPWQQALANYLTSRARQEAR